ncbi:MAG TPA: alpha-galactosidase [Phycisphaerales bacterium]|nr:alpha-galactosidase [Phycisphaerales bacterium]
MFKVKKLLVSAVFVVCILDSTLAGSNGIVRFANDGSNVIVKVDGISSFQGSSSAVYSQSGKTHSIGISDLDMIGKVRNAIADTPFGNASVSEATFGSKDSPFEYTLTLKNMESFKAFTVQAVFHNRSDSDINLASFDLIDTRKASGGVFKVANTDDWLVTSLMKNFSAVSLTEASKSMGEAAMIYHRNGNGFLVGPVGPAEAYTRVQAVKKAILATVKMDKVLVPAGQSRRSEEMLFIFEEPAVATDIWTRWVAVTHGARTHRDSVYGWCSWYDRTTNIDEKHVSNITKVIGDNEDIFGKGVIQIDDGYQRMDGDWSANDKFPSGMAAVAKRIRDIGCMPGVWFAPLMINPDHPWVKENPDAIRRNAKGIDSFMNPNAFHPAGAKWINPSHPESKKFLANIIGDARRRGFGYIKIDFNGIGRQFVDPTKTRLQAFRELYQTYREAAGEEMYILSCLGGPERGAIGYVDASRIAMDSHPAHFQGCLSKVLRTQIFHGVWWSANDPDVSYLAEKLKSRNLEPTPEGVGMWRTWHSVVALVGGTAMVSEPLDAPDAKQLWRNYSIMRPASAEPAKLLTLGVSANNEIFGFAAKRPYGDFAVYNLYNSTKKPMDITLDFSQAKLPSGVKCAVFDFWDNRFVGFATDKYCAVKVSPLSSKLLRFTPVDRADTGSPILIGSNLHLSMGATEIRNLSVTKSKVTIELTNAGAKDGSLTFYSVRPLKALGSNGCNVTSVEKKGDNIWQVNISDRKWAKEQTITLLVK